MLRRVNALSGSPPACRRASWYAIGDADSAVRGAANSAFRKMTAWLSCRSSSSCPSTPCNSTGRVVAFCAVRCRTADGAVLVWIDFASSSSHPAHLCWIAAGAELIGVGLTIRITLSATSSASRSNRSPGELMVALRWIGGAVTGMRAKLNWRPGATGGEMGSDLNFFRTSTTCSYSSQGLLIASFV